MINATLAAKSRQHTYTDWPMVRGFTASPLCCVAADALPMLDSDAQFEAAAEAQAIRNMQ